MKLMLFYLALSVFLQFSSLAQNTSDENSGSSHNAQPVSPPLSSLETLWREDCYLFSDEPALLLQEAYEAFVQKNNKESIINIKRASTFIKLEALRSKPAIKEHLLNKTMNWCNNKPDDDITMIVIKKK